MANTHVPILTPTASGISIPMSYTAHLAPLASSKLYADVTGPTRTAAAAETPYVVMMSQVNLLSVDTPATATANANERVQQCWQFEHPRRDLILDATGKFQIVPTVSLYLNRHYKPSF